MLRLLADENFNGDIVRGLSLRQPNLDLIRVQETAVAGADDADVLLSGTLRQDKKAVLPSRLRDLCRTCRLPIIRMLSLEPPLVNGVPWSVPGKELCFVTEVRSAV